MAGDGKEWPIEELDLLDEFYPIFGAKYVHELLPHRTPNAIKQRAFKRGLSSGINLANKGVWERGTCGEDSKLQTRLDLALRLLGPPQPILPTLRWAA